MAKEYRANTGLNFTTVTAPKDLRVERGDMVRVEDTPPHGTGRCDERSCKFPGAHDWMVAQGLLEDLDPVPAETPKEE